MSNSALRYGAAEAARRLTAANRTIKELALAIEGALPLLKDWRASIIDGCAVCGDASTLTGLAKDDVARIDHAILACDLALARRGKDNA